MERRSFLKLFGLPVIFPFLSVKNQARTSEAKDGRQILLGDFFIAGFQYHEGMKSAVIRTLCVGDELVLQREPGNPHDPLALAILTQQGAKLGYVPRTINSVPATIADQNVPLTARIAAIHPDADTREGVLVSVCMRI